jgi:hypothetical protein
MSIETFDCFETTDQTVPSKSTCDTPPKTLPFVDTPFSESLLLFDDEVLSMLHEDELLCADGLFEKPFAYLGKAPRLIIPPLPDVDPPDITLNK